MGKTYIDTVKYLIKANLEVGGIIEKPDIVGAIFGQTEGLLGDELDLRELQKNGRIGRIEVETQVRGGKTIGTILVPSSLDMVETSILGASLEIVDRVGPCEAKIIVERIEDSRSIKRKQLLDRAKSLLKNLVIEELPESKQLTELVRDETKIAEVATYGEDKLSCGPALATSESIVVVEGRADVINLLKNNIKNVVAVGGANVGKTIAKLCNEKEVTVFLDGDRGGDIILKELMAVADIDYVARAPAGKEVEELARKEIIQCLRRRVPVEQSTAVNGNRGNERGGDRDGNRGSEREREGSRSNERERDDRGDRSERMQPRTPLVSKPIFSRQLMPLRPNVNREDSREREREPMPARLMPAPVAASVGASAAGPAQLMESLKELEGSLKARLFGSNFEVLTEVPIRDIMRALTETEGVKAVVLDGIVTQRLVDLAEQKNAEFLVGVRAGTIMRKPANTKIIVSE